MGSHDPPSSPPPVSTKLKIYPIQQHPPESTILHQFAAKKLKNPRGHAHKPPLTCVFHLLNAKYQFTHYFTGGPINLFSKIPQQSNIRYPPPLQKFLGTGLSTSNQHQTSTGPVLGCKHQSFIYMCMCVAGSDQPAGFRCIRSHSTHVPSIWAPLSTRLKIVGPSPKFQTLPKIMKVIHL